MITLQFPNTFLPIHKTMLRCRCRYLLHFSSAVQEERSQCSLTHPSIGGVCDKVCSHSRCCWGLVAHCGSPILLLRHAFLTLPSKSRVIFLLEIPTWRVLCVPGSLNPEVPMTLVRIKHWLLAPVRLTSVMDSRWGFSLPRQAAWLFFGTSQ